MNKWSNVTMNDTCNISHLDNYIIHVHVLLLKKARLIMRAGEKVWIFELLLICCAFKAKFLPLKLRCHSHLNVCSTLLYSMVQLLHVQVHAKCMLKYCTVQWSCTVYRLYSDFYCTLMYCTCICTSTSRGGQYWQFWYRLRYKKNYLDITKYRLTTCSNWSPPTTRSDYYNTTFTMYL